MSAWVWVRKDTVLAMHNEQIAEHGGLSGIRDEGLIESALSRPVNQANYTETNVAALAAAYGFGMARNHPFIDGNKRTALLVTELFLVLNGYQLEAENASCLETFLALAAGTLPEDEFAQWLQDNISPETE